MTQEKVAEKSSKITAIPNLIDRLDLNNSVVTIDAMGYQKAMAQKIVSAGSDYVLAVKGNQNKPHEQISKHFNHLFDMEYNKYVDVSVILQKRK